MGEKQLNRYYYASISIRFFIGLLDLLVVLAIDIVLLLILNVIIYHDLKLHNSYDFLLYSSISFSLAVIYYVVIPYIFKCTLFMKIMKTKFIISKNKISFIMLFIHQFLNILIWFIVLLILGIILIFYPLNQYSILFSDIIKPFAINQQTSMSLVSAIISPIVIFSTILSFIVFLNTWYNNKLPNFIDNITKCVVVYTKHNEDDSINKPKVVKNTRSHVISQSALKELKKL